jgi:hypothetical protein
LTYGWILGLCAVIHTDPTERRWAREELAWWVPRARRTLETWWVPRARRTLETWSPWPLHGEGEHRCLVSSTLAPNRVGEEHDARIRSGTVGTQQSFAAIPLLGPKIVPRVLPLVVDRDSGGAGVASPNCCK